MGDNQDIGGVFKRQLLDFNKSPNGSIWEKIEAELNKKKKKRIIPLWIKLAGTAASIALLIFMKNMVSDNNLIIEPKIESPIITNTIDSILQDKNTTPKTQIITTKDVPIVFPKNKLTNPSDLIASPTRPNNKSTNENQNKFVQNKNLKTVRDIEKLNPSKIGKPSIIAHNKENVINTKISKFDSILLLSELSRNLLKAQTELNTSNLKTSDTIQKSTQILVKNQEENKFDENAYNFKKDSVNSSKWQISTIIAPVYYNTLSNGSSISSSLADNPSESELNLSFGVYIAYRLNNKVSIRTGVNNVNLGYTTNNIGTSLNGISNSFEVLNIGGVESSNNSTGNSSNSLDFLLFDAMSDEIIDLTQKISYVEIPLELKYHLINKKIGFNLIGGFSTLILNSNTISATFPSDIGSFKVGSVNNLNNISFSGNIGLGLDYTLLKQFHLNIEPMLKIQLNPYKNSDTNFKPYILGVYTGISYKF